MVLSRMCRDVVLSVVSFLFPFLFDYQNVCVVNALIKEEIESHM
jgi:hypothetical protein